MGASALAFAARIAPGGSVGVPSMSSVQEVIRRPNSLPLPDPAGVPRDVGRARCGPRPTPPAQRPGRSARSATSTCPNLQAISPPRGFGKDRPIAGNLNGQCRTPKSDKQGGYEGDFGVFAHPRHNLAISRALTDGCDHLVGWPRCHRQPGRRSARNCASPRSASGSCAWSASNPLKRRRWSPMTWDRCWPSVA